MHRYNIVTVSFSVGKEFSAPHIYLFFHIWLFYSSTLETNSKQNMNLLRPEGVRVVAFSIYTYENTLLYRDCCFKTE